MTENKLSALKNCKKCGRLFQADNGVSLCSRCNEDIDDEFTRVREYIYDNPSSSVKDVSSGTGVHTDAILKWIREGKIVLGSNSNIAFCERCGEPTTGSRFCPKCVKDLATGLKAGLEDSNHKQQVGMHIKESSKK
ncbi:MAG: MerR family transcriptional regulator [Bacillota bacterium]|nr:MerR family transcriptional regulator [Bacillota bacterium]